jgi:hypothetical protein
MKIVLALLALAYVVFRVSRVQHSRDTGRIRKRTRMGKRKFE